MKTVQLSNQSVQMREPKVLDMKAISSIHDDLEKEIMLLANLTEMTPSEIEGLNMADFNTLDKALQDFLS